ncbi:MAG: acyl-CoA dehydrogenase family protein, partial [Planctomycetes bacterium]|nr:acyl-CoA dehydrogenase family protein [Planctomycetota bacterium]
MIHLTEEHRDIREMVADFSDNELAPNAESIDEHSRFPSDALAQLGELGLLGAALPEEVGGGG